MNERHQTISARLRLIDRILYAIEESNPGILSHAAFHRVRSDVRVLLRLRRDEIIDAYLKPDTKSQ